MSNYNLDADEFIYYFCPCVSAGTSGSHSDTLLVTNRNIIFVAKNVFGKYKEAVKYPLSDVIMINSKPNVTLSRMISPTHKAEVYLYTRSLCFSFLSHDDAVKFADALETSAKNLNKKTEAVKEAPDIAGVISQKFKGAMSSAKNVINSFDKGPVAVTRKCPSCGAPLNGYKGSEVQCEYCGCTVLL